MTASDTTATIKKGNSEPSFDKTAQRILNLFFVLNSSPEPLTTEQIVLDSDLGYGSGNIDSDKRKFRRDRDKLLERGIVNQGGSPRRCAGDRGKLVDNRPRAHLCSRRPHHRRRRRYPAQRHRPDTSGRLIHFCRTACRYSLQDCLSHRYVDDGGRSTNPPLSHRRCGMERLCRAMRAAIFISERTRRADKNVPSVSTACSNARAWRTSAASTMSPTTSGHSAATVSFAHGVLRRPTPSLRTSISTTTLFFEFDFADRPPVAATFSFAPADADRYDQRPHARAR